MGPGPPESDLERFDFWLPEDAIARFPSARRGDSRLLVLDRVSGAISDRMVADLPQLFGSGDLFVFNNTRVSRRRVRLCRKSGARLEAVFLEHLGPGIWSVLLRGAARVAPGEDLLVADPSVRFPLFRFQKDPGSGPGNSILAAMDAQGGNAWPSVEEAESFFAAHGELPIPPYLGRAAQPIDQDRYQTIVAERTGSVAAPTAGLHFSHDLLGQLRRRGAADTSLELMIGYGTFAPLTEDNFTAGQLHREFYRISVECAAKYASCPGRRVAVGTTTLRALESERRATAGAPGLLRPGMHSTSLFVRPPDTVLSVDALLTNFHLPRSSLLLFVAAFTGVDFLMNAYAHAVREGYRFYSYGDAMLIQGEPPESS